MIDLFDDEYRRLLEQVANDESRMREIIIQIHENKRNDLNPTNIMAELNDIRDRHTRYEQLRNDNFSRALDSVSKIPTIEGLLSTTVEQDSKFIFSEKNLNNLLDHIEKNNIFNGIGYGLIDADTNKIYECKEVITLLLSLSIIVYTEHELTSYIFNYRCICNNNLKKISYYLLNAFLCFYIDVGTITKRNQYCELSTWLMLANKELISSHSKIKAMLSKVKKLPLEFKDCVAIIKDFEQGKTQTDVLGSLNQSNRDNTRGKSIISAYKIVKEELWKYKQHYLPGNEYLFLGLKLLRKSTKK